MGFVFAAEGQHRHARSERPGHARQGDRKRAALVGHRRAGVAGQFVGAGERLGNAQGDYYLERTNTLGRTGGYALLNLGARWAVDARNALSLQLRNVTDRAYVYAWYDSGSSGYSPGDGRALSVSWDWSF